MLTPAPFVVLPVLRAPRIVDDVHLVRARNGGGRCAKPMRHALRSAVQRRITFAVWPGG